MRQIKSAAHTLKVAPQAPNHARAAVSRDNIDYQKSQHRQSKGIFQAGAESFFRNQKIHVKREGQFNGYPKSKSFGSDIGK